MAGLERPTETQQSQKRLGKLPARHDTRTLLFAKFAEPRKVPATSNAWKKRAQFPPRTYANSVLGDCTRASQANHMTRLERLETKKTITITNEEVSRVYFDMTWRYYGDGANGAPMPSGWTDANGPGDVGAYELDALNCWRDPARTFRDTTGKPLTIAAYTRVNQLDQNEVKAAIYLSGSFGIKLCLNLPLAYARIDPPAAWDVPRGADGKPTTPTGEWVPGSWGGHSLFADAYSREGVRLVHSWYEGQGLPREQWPLDEQVLSWDGLATYCDEMYFVLDSPDHPAAAAGELDVKGIAKAVNRVSAVKLRV